MDVESGGVPLPKEPPGHTVEQHEPIPRGKVGPQTPDADLRNRAIQTQKKGPTTSS